MTLIIPTNETPTVHPKSLLRRYKYFFITKLPPIRHITFTAHMRFIAIKKTQQTLLRQRFELGQYLFLMLVKDGIRFAFYSLTDSFIACTKAFKKLRKVSRPTALLFAGRWASHSALAKLMRCRFALTASTIPASSVTLLGLTQIVKLL